MSTTLENSQEEFMNENPQPAVRPKRILKRRTKRLIFYWTMLAYFLLNIAIFHIYMKLDTFMMAFQYFTAGDDYQLISHFAGFDNFKHVAKIVFVSETENHYMFTATALAYAFTLLVQTPLSLLFSFYIYKKFFASEVFRVLLFLPSVVSGVVMVTLYKYIVTDMYVGFTGEVEHLLHASRPPVVKMIVIIVFILWNGFGTNILMYSSAMSGINESMVESSQLDGCNILQEFVHITIPGIYTTFTTFMVLGMAHIFTNQMALHTFFDRNAVTEVGFQTLGYYLYIKTLESPGIIFDENRPFELATPQLAALSLLTTCFVLPITLGGRKLMEKLGPSVN